MLRRNEADLLNDISGKLDSIEGSLDILIEILKDYTGYTKSSDKDADPEGVTKISSQTSLL
jgi:hypothetical protein